jgi:hypothetical protein
MKMIFDAIGALALFGGIVLFAVALFAGNYLQGTFYGVLSIAALVFAGILFLATKGSSE